MKSNEAEEAWFWDLVARSDGKRAVLGQLLVNASKSELQRFAAMFAQFCADLKDEPFLEFIDPAESEDGVDDITHWVVSQGRDRYQAVLDHPEEIPSHVDVGEERDLAGVAEAAYWDRFGEEMPLV